jgi:hypothetical protein
MYKCIKCNKEFKNKYDYSRHLNRKFPCNNILIIENNYIDEVSELKIKNEQLKIENEKLKQKVENLSNENKVTVVNNVNNGNVNGNVIINNNNNNNINVIQIVNHGQEDYKKINMNEILKKLENPPVFERVSSVIYYIHCNDDYPEYQNIYVTDLSRGKMKMYKDGEWQNMETKPVVEALYNKIIEHYDEDLEENNKIFTFIKKEAIKTYPCSSNYTDKNRKQGIDNSINILYNNRDKIKAIKVKKEVKKVINLIL